MFAATVVQSGLTFEQVLRDLPHDAGAVIVYIMLAAFIVLVWLGSRSPASKAGPDVPAPPQPPEPIPPASRRRRHG